MTISSSKELINENGICTTKDSNTCSMKINDLEVCYGANNVLHNVDMTIHRGKVTAIIGPSGCGKTTMLRCLNRMNELTGGCKVKGQILLDGEDILQMDPMLLRRKVGMVFQKLDVDHDETIRKCLEKAALWNELKNRLHESALALSLGQQQRLCIARTLAINPEIILFDEPASSLDPVSTATLESSILSMKGEYTQVIVTHNMNEARKISDYVVFFYMGKLLEFGETQNFFNHPQKEETKQYLSGSLY